MRACWDAQFTSSPAGDCLTKGASVLFFSQFESINNYILDRMDSCKSQLVDVRPEKKSRAEERRCGALPNLRSSPESSTRRRDEQRATRHRDAFPSRRSSISLLVGWNRCQIPITALDLIKLKDALISNHSSSCILSITHQLLF